MSEGEPRLVNPARQGNPTGLGAIILRGVTALRYINGPRLAVRKMTVDICDEDFMKALIISIMRIEVIL